MLSGEQNKNSLVEMPFSLQSFFFLIPDVEELSARLMHTIVDIRSIENGRIILEEPNKDRVFNPLEVRCVYLEQLLGKHNF